MDTHNRSHSSNLPLAIYHAWLSYCFVTCSFLPTKDSDGLRRAHSLIPKSPPRRPASPLPTLSPHHPPPHSPHHPPTPSPPQLPRLKLDKRTKIFSTEIRPEVHGKTGIRTPHSNIRPAHQDGSAHSLYCLFVGTPLSHLHRPASLRYW